MTLNSQRKNPPEQEVVHQLPLEQEVESKRWSDRWKQWMADEDDDNNADKTNFGTKCDFHLINNLTGTDLEKIQVERKATINQVCNMCRHKSSMECNHVLFDGEDHNNLMYKNLLVDDKHKVCTFLPPAHAGR